MSWRKDATVPEDKFDSAEAYYSTVRAGLRDKANHNKLEAQGCFAAIIVCTLLAPLFVTLGQGFWLAKVVPAVLSVAAAALTSWLQLRKPQRLWAIYRRGQRELEQAKANHDFNDAEYGDEGNKERLLARKVTEVAWKVHNEWEGLVPEPEALGSSATQTLPEN